MIREGRAPTEAWLPSDRLLSLALTLHEQSIAACGHYYDQAFGDKGDWVAGHTVCAACAAIERYQRDNETPEPGLKVWAVNDAEADDDAPGEVKPVFN